MMMRMRIISRDFWLIVGLATVAVWALVSPVSAEEVKVGAGAAPTENVFSRIAEPMEKAIGLKLVLISNGPVEAFQDLDAGKVDAAAGGVPIQDWFSLMESKGYGIADKSQYKHRVIGKDLIKVLVHKDISIKSLSRDQLKDIFTGKTKNWKEVGGPDQVIVVVWGNKIPGTNSVFQKQIMGDAPYITERLEVETAQEVKAKIIATSGAVGLGPLSIVDGSVGVPETPEVGRPIVLITKGAPSPAVLKMLDFISGEGQKYVVR